jgi:hypothetical protein
MFYLPSKTRSGKQGSTNMPSLHPKLVPSETATLASHAQVQKRRLPALHNPCTSLAFAVRASKQEHPRAL